jgi:hypothetical protein
MKFSHGSVLKTNITFVQLMGLETEADLGGSGMSFTSSLIAIEELAKVDPSVSAMVDIHVSVLT